jgi:hypothetical protein
VVDDELQDVTVVHKDPLPSFVSFSKDTYFINTTLVTVAGQFQINGTLSDGTEQETVFHFKITVIDPKTRVAANVFSNLNSSSSVKRKDAISTQNNDDEFEKAIIERA